MQYRKTREWFVLEFVTGISEKSEPFQKFQMFQMLLIYENQFSHFSKHIIFHRHPYGEIVCLKKRYAEKK